jgi:hypothetical protein
MKKYFSNNVNKYATEQTAAPKYSFGLAVPRSGALQACLCADKLIYSKKCCKGYLINQGIGNIQSPYFVHPSAFSSGFSDGFQ